MPRHRRCKRSAGTTASRTPRGTSSTRVSCWGFTSGSRTSRRVPRAEAWQTGPSTISCCRSEAVIITDTINGEMSADYRAAALALLVTLAATARADVIMDWNARADAIAADKRLPPPMQGRALAMMHVAMFEAVNAIERRYEPYRLKLVADRNTSRETAAAVAGHAVLVALYPDQQSGARCAARAKRSNRGRRRARRRNAASSSAAKRRQICSSCTPRMAARCRTTIDPSRSPVCTCPRHAGGRLDGARLHALGDDERGAVPSRAAAGVDLGNLDARPQRDSRDRRAQQHDAQPRSRPTSESSGS